MQVKLPIQPLITDPEGKLRFKRNRLVRAVVDHSANTGLSLNTIARLFDDEDYREEHQQLAQLIGYTLDGYGELSYVDDEAFEAAKIGYRRPPVVQEFDPNGSGSHRLLNTETGEFTLWADYTQFTFLDGMVGHTAYFGTTENVVTPEEFARLAGTTVAVPDEPNNLEEPDDDQFN